MSVNHLTSSDSNYKFSTAYPAVTISLLSSGKILAMFINVNPIASVTSSRTAIKITRLLDCGTPKCDAFKILYDTSYPISSNVFTI